MNEVFADTSGWASAFASSEPDPLRAATLMRQWQEQNRNVVTRNYVLGELVALFTRFRVPRLRGVSYIQRIRTATWIEVVHIDERLDAHAWE